MPARCAVELSSAAARVGARTGDKENEEGAEGDSRTARAPALLRLGFFFYTVGICARAAHAEGCDEEGEFEMHALPRAHLRGGQRPAGNRPPSLRCGRSCRPDQKGRESATAATAATAIGRVFQAYQWQEAGAQADDGGQQQRGEVAPLAALGHVDRAVVLIAAAGRFSPPLARAAARRAPARSRP
jgi:hypothetical protein